MTHPIYDGAIIVAIVVDELVARGATNRTQAAGLLPALERELGPLTDRERQAVLACMDTLITPDGTDQ